MSYIRPHMDVKATMYSRGKNGSYREWRTIETKAGYYCREELARAIANEVPKSQSTAMVSTWAPLSVVKPSVLSFKVKSPAEKTSLSRFSHPYYNKLGELTQRAKQQQFFSLLDVCLGPLAILFGGQGAYIGHNPKLTFAAQGSTAVFGNYSQDGGYTNVRLELKTTILRYQGISSFWLQHPTIFSLMMGVARTAFDLWCDRDYTVLAKKLGITACRTKLKTLSAKQRLTHNDRLYLLGKLRSVERLLKRKNVQKNIGAYPLNEYTWAMFLRLLQTRFHDKSIANNWRRRTNIYDELEPLGFYDWCLEQPRPSSRFRRASLANLGGTAEGGIFSYTP